MLFRSCGPDMLDLRAMGEDPPVLRQESRFLEVMVLQPGEGAGDHSGALGKLASECGNEAAEDDLMAETHARLARARLKF